MVWQGLSCSRQVELLQIKKVNGPTLAPFGIQCSLHVIVESDDTRGTHCIVFLLLIMVFLLVCNLKWMISCFCFFLMCLQKKYREYWDLLWCLLVLIHLFFIFPFTEHCIAPLNTHLYIIQNLEKLYFYVNPKSSRFGHVV